MYITGRGFGREMHVYLEGACTGEEPLMLPLGSSYRGPSACLRDNGPCFPEKPICGCLSFVLCSSKCLLHTEARVSFGTSFRHHCSAYNSPLAWQLPRASPLCSEWATYWPPRCSSSVTVTFLSSFACVVLSACRIPCPCIVCSWL